MLQSSCAVPKVSAVVNACDFSGIRAESQFRDAEFVWTGIILFEGGILLITTIVL